MPKKGKKKAAATDTAEAAVDAEEDKPAVEGAEIDDAASDTTKPKAKAKKKSAAKKKAKAAPGGAAEGGEGGEEDPDAKPEVKMEEAKVRKKGGPKKKAKAKAKKKTGDGDGTESAALDSPRPSKPKKKSKAKAKGASANASDVIGEGGAEIPSELGPGDEGVAPEMIECGGPPPDEEDGNAVAESGSDFSYDENEDPDMPWFGLEEVRAFKCKEHRIVIASGSIIDFSGEIIVNAANTLGIGGGGIDGQITEAGGELMAKERFDLPLLNKETGERIPVGEGRMTSAGGKLQCRNAIHAVGPKFRSKGGSGKEAEQQEEQLQSAYIGCLRMAVKQKVRAIAFSLLSIGTFLGPRRLDEVLRIAWDTVIEWCKSDESDENPIEIYFCCLTNEELGTLEMVAMSETSKPDRGKVGKFLSKAKFW